MNILLLGEKISIHNAIEEIESFIEIMNNRLRESRNFYSHMIVDGKEIYLDPLDYLIENISEVENVCIETRTVSEFISEILCSLEEYSDRVIPVIVSLTDEIYKGANEQTWNVFNQLLEGINWVLEAIMAIGQINYVPKNWNNYLEVHSKEPN